MRRARGAWALLFLLLLPASAEEAARLVPARSLQPLEGSIKDLARAGYGAEAGELLETATELGLSEEKIARLRRTLVANEKKSRPSGPGRKSERIAKNLRRTVKTLAELLAGLSEERRKALAELLLDIDGNCEPARLCLGHVRHGDTWRSPKAIALEKRRASFHGVLSEARRMETPVEVLETVHPLVEEVSGVRGSAMRAGPLTVHGPHSRHKLERIVTESLRARAIVNWLLLDRLEIPKSTGITVIMFVTRAELTRAFSMAGKHGISLEGRLSDVSAAYGTANGKRCLIGYNRTEARAETSLLNIACDTDWFGDKVNLGYISTQPCLGLGIVNLVSLAFIGHPQPGFTIRHLTEEEKRATSGLTEKMAKLRFALPRMGLMAHRRRMTYLVRDGRDPPWARCMRGQWGKIVGDERIKATLMVEFLAEHGPLADLFLDTKPDKCETPPIRSFEKSLGESLATLEDRWRSWLLGPTNSSLVDRLLERSGPRTGSPEEMACLARLNAIRRGAGAPDCGRDEVLSRGAQVHAEYLRQNPEQAGKWPDAHEEWPDRPGFSVEGSWAGGHSVIHPGCSTPRDAIGGWMGTFYHRLPLIHPGLLYVGWGRAADIAVLDASSLVVNPPGSSEGGNEMSICWPHDNMKNTPTRFRPELPNPVPGANQAEWGYPVTLQLWRAAGMALEVRMLLRAGSRTGPVVDCHYSTPSLPTNPELAPRNAYCLIPKSHLEARTKYFVTATVQPGNETIEWSFHTGSK